MAKRQIILHPDPRLKKACEPIGAVDDEIRTLAADMLQAMYDAPGVGLAAPQVGVLRRLLVMDCAGAEDTATPMTLINPEVTWSSEDTNTHNEGCLSIPDFYEDVTRPASVRVRFTDLEGAEREEAFDGLWSTCVQHEIDHLNGKLFIDYLGPVRRQMITAKMKKVKRDLAKQVAAA